MCIEHDSMQHNKASEKLNLIWNQHSQMRLNLKYEPNWIDGLLKEKQTKKINIPQRL